MDEEANDIDPLDEIFVDRNEPADKKILAEIIGPHVRIDNDGILDFTEEYERLTNIKKVLVYLAAKKAMKLRKIVNSELAGPAEVSEKALISNSDAKNALYNQYKKLVENKKGKGYTIPNYKLKKVKKEIFSNKK